MSVGGGGGREYLKSCRCSPPERDDPPHANIRPPGRILPVSTSVSVNDAVAFWEKQIHRQFSGSAVEPKPTDQEANKPEETDVNY